MVVFLAPITVEGTAYQMGQVVELSTLPAGSVECLYRGFIRNLTEDELAQIQPSQSEADEAATSSKKKGK